MLVFLETFIIVFLLGLVIYFIPLKLEINYSKKGKDDFFSVRLQVIPGILVYKAEVPLLNWEGEYTPKLVLQSELENTSGKPITKGGFEIKNPFKILLKLAKMWPVKTIQRLLPLIKKILTNNKRIFKKIHCKKLKWITEIGFSNPAITGMSIGIIWSLKSWFYSNMNKNIQLDFTKAHFEVIPHFYDEQLKLNFHCIFTARTGHIIIAASRLLYIVIITFLFHKGGINFER